MYTCCVYYLALAHTNWCCRFCPQLAPIREASSKRLYSCGNAGEWHLHSSCVLLSSVHVDALFQLCRRATFKVSRASTCKLLTDPPTLSFHCRKPAAIACIALAARMLTTCLGNRCSTAADLVAATRVAWNAGAAATAGTKAAVGRPAGS